MNVSLRDVRAEDGAWLDAWLGACAASVRYDTIEVNEPSRSLAAAIEAGLRAQVIVADEPAGVITYRAHTPAPTEAIIEFVGVEPAYARRGHGQAAAAVLADALREADVQRIFAPAPEMHGIAMYFWIRLGYRPLMRSEWPCAREGTAWLVRDLA